MKSKLPPKPSILDKLLSPTTEQSRPVQPFYVPRTDRFGDRELRDVIRRDIGWLLNDVHFEAVVPLDDVPEVRTAVLNHGLVDLVGRATDANVLNQRAAEVVAAIRAFEQRLDPASLKVTFDTSEIESHNTLRFTIHGEIRNAIEEAWVELSSAVDLADGHVEIAR